jgi:hypothetical protein
MMSIQGGIKRLKNSSTKKKQRENPLLPELMMKRHGGKINWLKFKKQLIGTHINPS